MINYDLSGKTVKILGLDDVIEKGDFIRYLIETSYDGGGWNTTFKPEGWSGTKWHPVKTELSGWIGKTQRDYLYFDKDAEAIRQIAEYGYMPYEIARVVG